MLTRDLDFDFPPELVATEPRADFRILCGGSDPREISKSELFKLFQPGDALVINDTQVVKRRVFSESGLEILFLESQSPGQWQVLFPAREVKDHQAIPLPGGLTAKLVSRGLPQTIETSKSLDEDYFARYGELALPPYIQKARGERHNSDLDDSWYMTAWGSQPGSVAAPTASLHFTNTDLKELQQAGVNVVNTTLHVGIGTFLPVKTERLDEHKMHREWAYIPNETIAVLNETKKSRARIWALGTTAVRAVESWANGKLEPHAQGASGETDLFIQPGYQFEVVNGLLTNFHQPRSTLIAMVGAFAGLENVKKSYAFAIAEKFRLFSYGDLSVWLKD